MDDSLLPREIPAGGVGTCRRDCSDMSTAVTVGDVGEKCRMGGDGEREEGRGWLFIYEAG
jgi:hypothetical protein